MTQQNNLIIEQNKKEQHRRLGLGFSDAQAHFWAPTRSLLSPPIPTSQTTKPVGTARLLAAFGISRLSTTIFQWGRA